MAKDETPEGVRREELKGLLYEQLELAGMPEKVVLIRTKGENLTKVTVLATLIADVTPGEEGG